MSEPEDPYERLDRMRGGSREEQIVAAIWADVTDRRGWRQEADQFEDRIKHEILDRWVEIVRAH
jgi:hypothetical protein